MEGLARTFCEKHTYTPATCFRGSHLPEKRQGYPIHIPSENGPKEEGYMASKPLALRPRAPYHIPNSNPLPAALERSSFSASETFAIGSAAEEKAETSKARRNRSMEQCRGKTVRTQAAVRLVRICARSMMGCRPLTYINPSPMHPSANRL